MVEAQRQGQHAVHNRLAINSHDTCIDVPGAEDCDLRGHHDEACEAPPDRAEIAQGDRRADQLIARDRASRQLLFEAIERLPEFALMNQALMPPFSLP